MKKLGNLTLKITENYLSKNSKIEGKLLLNWNKLFINYNEKFKLYRVLFLKNQKNKGMLILNVKRGFELEIQSNQKMLHPDKETIYNNKIKQNEIE